MADQGGGQDEAKLPFKDTLGSKERKVYDNTVNLLSPDKAHAGLSALTRLTKDQQVKAIIAGEELPKVGPDTRNDYRAIVEAEGRRRSESATKAYNDRLTQIAESGTQPYLDMVGKMPENAEYSVGYLGNLFKSNTPENRVKGINAAHLRFAHVLHQVADARRGQAENPGSQSTNPAFRYGSEIAITALAQFLPAIDEAFVERGMEPFSKNPYWERGDDWGDQVWQEIRWEFGKVPDGKSLLDGYVMEAAAGKRVAALAPKPEVASPPTEVSNTGENPFTRAARLRREEQANLANTRAKLDNPFDGVK